MLPKDVSDYLDSHRQDHLETLCELLRIPSVANEKTDACQRAAQWLAGHLDRLGVEARVMETAGRPNVIARLHVRDDAPTLLVYGHYDVQPAEPLELWNSPPFEPQVRDGNLYARGADDDKGQLFTHLMALEAWQACSGPPCNLKFFFEGEEEVGSPDLEPFIAEHVELLRAHAAVISDSDFFAPGVPSITYALRGLAYLELTLHGPQVDIHSGSHGGAVANPVNGLAQMVARLADDNGRITVPGFYDDVLELSDAERTEWDSLPFDEAEYAAGLGVDALGGGERGFSTLERRWARPTLDANGIFGGYTGYGSKTIIPSRATVKISMRLVSDQDPAKVVEGFRQYVREHTPPGLRAEVQVFTTARPVLLDRGQPAMEAAQAALEECFGRRAAFIRCGASVPVTELIQRLLGLDAVLLGYGLPSDNLHSPNEHFSLDQFYRGAKTNAAFLHNFAQTWR